MKFLKLRMIWAIVRGRSVMYKMEMDRDCISPMTDHCCIINNIYTKCNTEGIWKYGRLEKTINKNDYKY